MDVRALTRREREVLEALLAVDFPGAEAQRLQAAGVVVVGGCACGCPSVDFRHGPGRGMTIRVNANIPGSYDSLFLYTIEDPEQGHLLGGIEWAGIETNPAEFPSPELLEIQPA